MNIGVCISFLTQVFYMRNHRVPIIQEIFDLLNIYKSVSSASRLVKFYFMISKLFRQTQFLILYNFFLKLFTYLFLVVLGLHCYMMAFSSCGKRGSSLAVWCFSCRWLLLLQSTGSRHSVSVAVAHRLNCCMACGGIFLDQGSNPCRLHWQGDS